MFDEKILANLSAVGSCAHQLQSISR